MSLDAIQHYITNKLPDIKHKTICGIIGEQPSKSARSPVVWNAVFQKLGKDAIFLPFDVDSKKNLECFVKVLRESDFVNGVSVTTPYKQAITPLLDNVDYKAQLIGAVNFVRRTESGKLVGYNTDGLGGLKSLLEVQPDRHEVFIDTLLGRNVVLYGTGGAARALAFYVAAELGEGGKLSILNRNLGKAERLAAEIKRCNDIVVNGLDENRLFGNNHLIGRNVDLIINATTKGQAGVVKTGEGRFTCLEPYSALYEARPATMSNFYYNKWFAKSLDSIANNNEASGSIVALLPKETAFFDAVHTPAETVMLRQARLSGRKTLNGKNMNVCQAAAAYKLAFPEADYNQVLETMYRVT
jgi:shikimate dehydrogenase